MKTTSLQMSKRSPQPIAPIQSLRREGWKRILLVAGVAIVGGSLFSGCSTGKPASASFASIVIAAQSVEQIQQATKTVFETAGYKAHRASGGMMIFEKEGSRGQQIVYGGLGAAEYGAAVSVRVRAEIVDLTGQDARRLQCKAFIVHDAGQGIFEDEQPLANFHRGPYQKLLDAVAAKLK